MKFSASAMLCLAMGAASSSAFVPMKGAFVGKSKSASTHVGGKHAFALSMTGKNSSEEVAAVDSASASADSSSPVPLSLANFPTLQAAGKVEIPTYDPTLLTGGILHLGMGNFHRSHFAAYVHDVLNDPELFENNKEWGIIGAGIRSDNNRNMLMDQEWLQTLVERDGNSAKASVLAHMIDFIKVEDLQESLSNDENIKIVSITATEGGYFLDATGRFNPEDEAVQYDIANPDEPKTIFGKIVKGLKARKEAGMAPFTVLSADNIPHNGDVTKGVIMGLAKSQPELAAWIDENVTCPNNMVDRITPGTTDAMRETVETDFGVKDASPVFCEPFRQWVIEDNFCQGRPEFEKISEDKSPYIIFTEDVSPYEFMKIRILNGGHASLCYPAGLLELEYVHDAMEHPVIRPFLDTLERTELIPTVPPVPDTDLSEYWETVEERFSNPTINDTMERICFDGSSRQPKFIVPPAADQLKAGGKIDGLALVSAMWCRYCQGTTEKGNVIPDNDPIWDRLQDLATQARLEPSAWLTGLVDVYGEDVSSSEVFQAAFAKALKKVEEDGVEAAMKEYTAANSS